MSTSTIPSAFQTTTANSSQSSFNGDDFSDNLFTDLGPLLALFGAEVTTQFMSQSLTWADHVLFAIGPLGVVTAIVSAIRVGGPYGLRAFIGRAREPRAEIERALMSSTSKEVCEMWNGESLVRVIGEPKIAELLLVFEKDHKKLLKSEGHGWAVELKEDCKFVKDNTSHEPDKSKMPLEDEDAIERSIARSRRAKRTSNSLNAPNISLNHTPSRNPAEKILFCVVAVILQSVVLLLDAFITYRWKFLKEGRRVGQSAFPLLLAGTVGLTAGMFVCSAVVEKSTREVWYRFEKDQPIELLWLQKKGVVADQNFESYAIFAAEGRRAVVDSTREEYFQREGVHFDDELFEELTLKIFSINLVTMGGVFLSLVGYVVQFVGFRQMHWLATIFQLILSVTMTAIRSWVRRDLSRQPFNQKLRDGHEMDWVATRDKLYGSSDGTAHISTASSSSGFPDKKARSPRKLSHALSRFLRDQVIWKREKPQSWYGNDADRYKWFIVDSHIPDMEKTYRGSRRALPRDLTTVDNMRQEKAQLNIADAVLGVRERIKDLIAWHSPVEEAASSIIYAIEAVMNHISNEDLFTVSNQLKEEFVWGFQVGEAKETVYLHVSNETGSRRTIRPSIEAALSLWVHELSLAEATLPQPHERERVENTWRIGPKTDSLERDCAWWVFKGSDSQYSTPHGLEGHPVSRSRHFKDRPGWPEEIKTDYPSIFREFGPGVAIKESQGNEKCVEALSVALHSGYDIPRMCAWHLFTIFMFWVSESILEVKGTTSFESQTENVPGWLRNSVKLTNSSLESLAKEIEASKLCSPEEAYMSIVPPLSMAGKLPMPTAVIDCGLKVARSLEKQKSWKAATDVYVELLHTCGSFGLASEMLAKSLAVSAEFLTLLCHAEEVYMIRADEIAIEENMRMRSLIEAEIKRNDPKVLRSLKALYRCQREAREVQNLSISQSSGSHKQLDSKQIRRDLSQNHIWAWNDLFLDVAANDSKTLDQHLENAKDRSLDIEAQDIFGWSPLHYAAQNIAESKENEDKCLQSLLRKGLDPNCPNILGLTPLHCAVKAEVISSIDTLVQYGARMDAKTVDGKTALHIAARSRDRDIASALCEKGADIEARDNFEQTPLHLAALTGSVDVVFLLLEWKVKPRVREESGLTPLHAICGQTRTTTRVGDVVDRFLEEGAALEVTDRNGQTPLHFAARSGCTEALKALLATRKNGRSANVRALDAAGMNPFHVAAKYCQLNSAEILLKTSESNKRIMHFQDWNGKTPLHHAVNSISARPSDRVRFVDFLLRHGVGVNEEDRDGITPLHYCKDLEVLKLLIEGGADIYAKDRAGRKPLHTARDPEVIRELLKRQGVDRYNDMNLLRDDRSMTPLHSVAQSGNVLAMEVHLEDGAPIDVKDLEERTPLHLAVQISDSDLSPLRLLLDYHAPLDPVDADDKTALELAVESKMRGAVNMLLQEFEKRSMKIRPKTLHTAAKSGDLELMKLLLCEQPAHINEKDEDEMTPLHTAVEWGNMAIADLLVERGADQRATDRKSRTPVQLIRTTETRILYEKKWIASGSTLKA